MDKYKKFTFLLYLTLLMFFSSGGFLYALEVNYPSVLGFSLRDNATLPEYAGYFYGLGIALACFVALGTIAYGGIQYLISYARGRFTSEGKEIIKAGGLGFMIVICAYLIAYTINPDLVNFRLAGLPDIFSQTPNIGLLGSGGKTVTYKEIPVGMLTEKLLTRTMSCYAFDAKGDPIEGEQIEVQDPENPRRKLNINAPTHLLTHDRADCFTLLFDGAQKNGYLAGRLSDELIKLMNTCDCKGKCSDTCGGQSGCNNYNGICPLPKGVSGLCTGACSKLSNPYTQKCEQAQGIEDCCPKDALDSTGQSLGISVKKQIEHGPIEIGCGCQTKDSKKPGFCKGKCVNGDCSVSLANCQTSKPDKPGFCQGQCNNKSCVTKTDCGCEIGVKTYKGLDEFRCPVSENGQDKNNCPNLNGSSSSSLAPCYGISGFVEETFKYKEKEIKIINKCKWDALNLMQKMQYFQEKIQEYTQKLQKDNAELARAENALSKCYLASPYIDIVKDFRGSDRKEKMILVQKPFFDVESSPAQAIDVSKYCKGFNYGNSKCFKKCNDMCPDNGPDAMQCYASCGQCNYSDFECLERQEMCIKVCYTEKRKCILSDDPSKSFMDCMFGCQDDCLQDCAKKDLLCSDDYKMCDENCKADSQCVLDNAGTCLFDSSDMQNCASQNIDNENKRYCLDRAYLCKNGSNENAGYAECVDGVLNIKSSQNSGPCGNGEQMQTCVDGTKSCNCPENNNDNNKCQTVDPSRPNYCPGGNICFNGKCIDRPTCQTVDPEAPGYCPGGQACADGKCVANSDSSSGSSSGSSSSGTGGGGKCNTFAYSSSFLYQHPECQKCPKPFEPPKSGTICYNTSKTNESCQNLCPETSKCPSASRCPNCSCSFIDKTVSFNLPTSYLAPGANGQNQGTKITIPIKAYRITGPECNEYSYNDDPLTFYCEDSWWNNPNREGKSQTPIGKERVCAKEGEIPVGKMIDDAEDWANSIAMAADQTIKSIQRIVTQMEKAGTAKQPYKIEKDYCKCMAKWANARPICSTDCKYGQKIIQVPAVDAKGKPILGPNGVQLTTPKWECSCTFTECEGSPCQQMIDYLKEIWNHFANLKIQYSGFYASMAQEPRSDILKEVTYSRKATDSCSLVANNYGVESRLLSCTRVMDEMIAPVNNGYYAYNNRVFNGYCYGQALGNIFSKSFADNWFCCQEWQKQTSK